jgi:hypothetical protein
MEVSFSNFKPYQKNSLAGFFDMEYEGLTIKGCSLFKKDDKIWFACPSQKKVDQNGTTTYEPFVEVSNDFRKKLELYLTRWAWRVIPSSPGSIPNTPTYDEQNFKLEDFLVDAPDPFKN